MKRSNVMHILMVALLLCGGAHIPVAMAGPLEKKLDSLFIIASSGELKFRDLVKPAQDSIAAMGTSVVPLLVDKLDTKSPRERLAINDILKKIGSPAVPFLNQSLKLTNGLIVERVCTALGDIKDTGAVAPLLTVVNRPRWQVRDQAIGALGEIGDQRGSEAVVAALNDSIGLVRKSAAVSAGQLKLNSHIARLVGMFDDPFYGARLPAAQSLLQLDTAAVVQALTDSLNSANPQIGHLACTVLGQLATHDAIEALLAQTKSEDPVRRAHAGVALVAADPVDDCGYQKNLLPLETDRLVRLKVESALPKKP